MCKEKKIMQCIADGKSQRAIAPKILEVSKKYGVIRCSSIYTKWQATS